MGLPVVIPCIAATRYYAGRSLGTTEWLTISQERIDCFASATGDRRWIHTDVGRASREAPWKGTIADGYLLLSLVPDLLPQLVVLLGWTRAINAGADRCEFPGPAPAGSRVRMLARFAKARMLPGGCRMTFDLEFEVEGSETPACRASVHYVYFG